MVNRSLPITNLPTQATCRSSIGANVPKPRPLLVRPKLKSLFIASDWQERRSTAPAASNRRTSHTRAGKVVFSSITSLFHFVSPQTVQPALIHNLSPIQKHQNQDVRRQCRNEHSDCPAERLSSILRQRWPLTLPTTLPILKHARAIIWKLADILASVETKQPFAILALGKAACEWVVGLGGWFHGGLLEGRNDQSNNSNTQKNCGNQGKWPP